MNLVVAAPVFGPAFTGGVRSAVGDVNGDGRPDLVLAPGPGLQAFALVLSGADASLLHLLVPFDDFTGGAFVAVGSAR